MNTPPRPRLYHIVHADRLPSILADGHIWSDAEVLRRSPAGTTIGMNRIKKRRLNDLTLSSHPDLHVGDCVPFYFCPRSVMLYVIYMANDPDLEYRDGEEPIVHLELDLLAVVSWAEQHGRRWAFTLSNAGSKFFEDRSGLSRLDEIDWAAVNADDWRACKEGKQAEFLLEHAAPWSLVQSIGVLTPETREGVVKALKGSTHSPNVEIRKDWYYSKEGRLP
jgi:hypothetical protein